MIPMGERAFSWVRTYLDEARPSLALDPELVAELADEEAELADGEG
jgi:site-specific recombinase XerD